MKILKSIGILILIILISNCNHPQDEGLVQKVQELEQKLDSIQSQLTDQTSKTRLAFMQINSNPLFNSPWEDFLLASDEFWNNPVDVGAFECSRRCIEDAQRRLKICNTMPDGQGKIDCVLESTELARKCQKGCQDRFPPSL